MIKKYWVLLVLLLPSLAMASLAPFYSPYKGGKGGSAGQTPDFTTDDKLVEAKYGRADAIPNIPESYVKQVQKGWEDIKKLDQECAEKNEKSVCDKANKGRVAHLKVMNSFTRAHFDDQPESEDKSGKALAEKLAKTTDPKKMADKSTEESEKKQGLDPADKTIDKIRKAKGNENKKEFKSKKIAMASNKFMAGGDAAGELKNGKGHVAKVGKRPPVKNPEKVPDQMGRIGFFESLFFRQTIAAGSLEESKKGFFNRFKNSVTEFFKGGGKAREEGAKSFDQGKYVSQGQLQSILARGSSQTIKRQYQAFNEERNHQTKLTNDIAGEGEAATDARHSKNMDERKKSIGELDKSIKAIAKICQSQRANIKCWKTGNTPPPLPFPFGGGPPPKKIPEVETEDWGELIKRSASYYCPKPNEPFVLTGEKGIWHSGMIITPKGIVLTHFDPLNGFDFHEKGCLLRMPNPLKLKEFEVYVAEPRFINGISTRDNLIFLVPTSAHVENSQLLGVAEKKRKFPTILDYIKDSGEACKESSLKLGTPLKLIGYNIPKKYEKERETSVFDGLSTAFPNGEQKTMTAVIEANDGMTGGIVAHKETKCFQGVVKIKKVDEETTIRDIIPLETLQDFIKESIKVLGEDS